MDYLIHFSDGSDAVLAHHGILGQKWGVRRYQNQDGTLTATGKKRQLRDLKSAYISDKKRSKQAKKELNKSGTKVLGIFRVDPDEKLVSKYDNAQKKAAESRHEYELAKSSQKGRMTKKLIRMERDKEYNRAYEEFSKKYDDSTELHERAEKQAEKKLKSLYKENGYKYRTPQERAAIAANIASGAAIAAMALSAFGGSYVSSFDNSSSINAGRDAAFKVIKGGQPSLRDLADKYYTF